MASRAVVGYESEQGEWRGTYVQGVGTPQEALEAAWDLLHELGFERAKVWVEEGITGGGYRFLAADSPTYDDIEEGEARSVGKKTEALTVVLRPTRVRLLTA